MSHVNSVFSQVTAFYIWIFSQVNFIYLKKTHNAHFHMWIAFRSIWLTSSFTCGFKCRVETKHGAVKWHEFASLGANSTFLDMTGNFEMSIKTSIWRWRVSPMCRDCYWRSRQGFDSNLWPFVACHPPSL